MISNNYFGRITYKDTYGSPRDINNCFDTTMKRDEWVQTQLSKLATGDNKPTDIVIRFGEVSEEYSAAKIWQLTPINGTKSNTSLPTKEHTVLEV